MVVGISAGCIYDSGAAVTEYSFDIGSWTAGFYVRVNSALRASKAMSSYGSISKNNYFIFIILFIYTANFFFYRI